MSTRSHAEYCTHDVCSRPMWGQCDILSNPKYKPAVEPPHAPHSTAEQIDSTVDEFITKWCGEYAPHLLDSDDNDGQRLKAKLLSLMEDARTEAERYGRANEHHVISRMFDNDELAKLSPSTLKGLKRRQSELLKSSRTEVTK